MEDLGAPSSYLALEPGARVYYRDGAELGVVARILAEGDADIFEGIEVDSGLLSRRRFVAADLILEIYERGILLTIDSSAGEGLPDAR
jgi:hypothetical protein